MQIIRVKNLAILSLLKYLGYFADVYLLNFVMLDLYSYCTVLYHIAQKTNTFLLSKLLLQKVVSATKLLIQKVVSASKLMIQ